MSGASSRVSEVLPDLRVALAPNPGPMTLDGSRSYLVGVGETVLIDPGPGDDDQEARIRALVGERTVRAVCLTHAHADHAGGAERVATRLGAPLAASAATLERLGIRGRILEDGTTVEVDGGASRLTALETPGHSGDHVSYLWSPRRFLFTGDLVLGAGTAMVGAPDGHMGAYLASLSRLASLRPVRLYPGHGDPVERPEARLAEYRRHRLEREEQIAAAVDEGAGTVEEIRQRVYPELDPALQWAAEASIRAHLTHLEERGRELPAVSGRTASSPAPEH